MGHSLNGGRTCNISSIFGPKLLRGGGWGFPGFERGRGVLCDVSSVCYLFVSIQSESEVSL